MEGLLTGAGCSILRSLWKKFRVFCFSGLLARLPIGASRDNALAGLAVVGRAAGALDGKGMGTSTL